MTYSAIEEDQTLVVEEVANVISVC